MKKVLLLFALSFPLQARTRDIQDRGRGEASSQSMSCSIAKRDGHAGLRQQCFRDRNSSAEVHDVVVGECVCQQRGRTHYCYVPISGKCTTER